MLKHQTLEKVSVDVYEENHQFFASVDFANSQHSLGPVASRDEIYQLVFGFISDLRLFAEANSKMFHRGKFNE
jgi:hypothetical protein